MTTARQSAIHGRLPRIKGHMRSDFAELDRLLRTYAYNEQELDVIEKGLVEFEEAQEKKRAAKEEKRRAIKEAKNRERSKHA